VRGRTQQRSHIGKTRGGGRHGVPESKKKRGREGRAQQCRRRKDDEGRETDQEGSAMYGTGAGGKDIIVGTRLRVQPLKDWYERKAKQRKSGQTSVQ